jgi:hypothetical protein
MNTGERRILTPPELLAPQQPQPTTGFQPEILAPQQPQPITGFQPEILAQQQAIANPPRRFLNPMRNINTGERRILTPPELTTGSNRRFKTARRSYF